MSFRDKENRAWTPVVDIITIRRVRDALDINVLELMVPGSGLPDRLNDPCLLVDVLYLLCKDEADRLNIDDQSFGRAMTPDGIRDAFREISEGVVNFSHSGIRPAYRKILETAIRYDKKQTELLAALMENPEFDTMIERGMEEYLSRPEYLPIPSSDGAISLEGSSESTPDATLSQP